MAARSDATVRPFAALREPRTQRIIGIAALALATALVGAWRMGWIGGTNPEDDVVVRTPVHAVRPSHAPAKAGAPDVIRGAKVVDVIAPPAAAPVPVMGPQPAPRPATRLASTQPVDAPVLTVVPVSPPAAPEQRLEEHVTYQYNALGRRDPFVSLIGGAFVGADVGGEAPPDPGGIRVVGIVWGANDQFAMVEDVRGNSYVLRKGDALQNGVVDELRRDALVVSVKTDGQSQQVVIPFVRKGDGNER
jgi:hypothetical protein